MELAAIVTGLIAPFLRGFLDKGAEVASDLGQEAAKGTEGLARRIWHRLFPKVQENPDVAKAAETAADAPEDTRATGALELELEKLFAKDTPLAKELQGLVDDAKRSGVSVQVGSMSADRGGVNVAGENQGDINAGYHVTKE